MRCPKRWNSCMYKNDSSTKFSNYPKQESQKWYRNLIIGPPIELTWTKYLPKPWNFPDQWQISLTFFQNSEFPWLFSKFPDFSLTLNFPDFSQTVATWHFVGQKSFRHTIKLMDQWKLKFHWLHPFSQKLVLSSLKENIWFMLCVIKTLSWSKFHILRSHLSSHRKRYIVSVSNNPSWLW